MLKEAFLATAVKMYPEGLKAEPRQHRDVIRIYAGGWRDAAVQADNRGMIVDAAVDCKQISDPNWWPDKSWRWWEQ